MDLTPSQALDFIEAAIRHNLDAAMAGKGIGSYIVPMLEGPPGVGKTTVVRDAGKRIAADKDYLGEVAKACGVPGNEYFTRTIIAAQVSAVDVAGIPWAADRSDAGPLMVRLRPEELPTNEICTMFYDEIRKAPTSVVNAISQCFLEGRIGPHRISPLATYVLASNERKDRAGDIELPSHTLDRVTLVRVVASREDFISYGRARGMHPLVLFFLEAMPQYFNRHEEDSLVQPTPRSFERAAEYMASGRFEGQLLRAALEGVLGPSCGHALYWFARIRESLVPPQQVLDNPDGVDIPKDRQAQWVLMAGLVEIVSKETIGAFSRFLARFDETVSNGRELSIMSIRMLYGRAESLFYTPEGAKMAARYLDALSGA